MPLLAKDADLILEACVFRTRNIHTLHSPVYLCWPLGCLGVSLCLWDPFLERGIPFSPVYLCWTQHLIACIIASRL